MRQFYTANEQKMLGRQHNIKKWTDPLQVQILENGMILPCRQIPQLKGNANVYEGGVCDSEFNFVTGYARHSKYKPNHCTCIRSYVPAEPLVQDNTEVWFMGVMLHHFGHTLMETLTRAYAIKKYRLANSNAKLAFISTRNTREDPVLWSFLDLLGISREQIIVVTTPTQFRKIHVPEQAVYINEAWHPEFATPYRQMADTCPPLHRLPRKIYLSRGQWEQGDTFNEEYFENFYQKHGYEVIYPEQHSIRKQIALVAGADAIATTYGTLSHLILFAKPNARVDILCRTPVPIRAYQFMIDAATGITPRYVDVGMPILPSDHLIRAYMIGPTQFWREFLTDQYPESTITSDDRYESMASVGRYVQRWVQHMEIREFFRLKATTPYDIVGAVLHTFMPPLPVQRIMADAHDTNNLAVQLYGKRFNLFTLRDGTNLKFSRTLTLLDNHHIEAENGKHYKNEAFWDVHENRLTFYSDTFKPRHTYDEPVVKDGQMQLSGRRHGNNITIVILKEFDQLDINRVKAHSHAEKKLRNTRKKLRHTEKQLRKMTRSRSWRITRPLRALGQATRTLAHPLWPK